MRFSILLSFLCVPFDVPFGFPFTMFRASAQGMAQSRLCVSAVGAALLAAFILSAVEGCMPAPTPTPAQRFKLFVSRDGLYRVTGTALQAAGADLDQIDAATLQLFRGDQEIALRVLGDWSFEFYGQASDSPYSAFNVYWLRWGVQAGKRMREIPAAPATSAPKESFQSTIRMTRPSLYIPQAGEPGNHWFWQSLTAPMTTTIPITLPAALPSPARLHVNLWSSTQDPATPDHHLRIFFNDVRIADETWDGQGARVVDAAIPATAVRAGENVLRLIAPGDTRAQADIVLLRSIEVTHARRFIAQQDALEFEGGTGTYHVEGFSDDATDLFDISDPAAPIRVTSVTVAARSITFATDASAPRRWLALGPTARQSIARIVPMGRGGVKGGVTPPLHIIITHPDFVDALQPLARWREQRGLKVSLVTTTEIYDEFGNGAESPLALRASLDWAYRQWAPRFVLLVGKASYDYRDYLNGPNKNLVPTFLMPTLHLGQAASDNWFVAADEKTGRPRLAIGRIPAKTRDQVARVVNKIIAYESAGSADWRRRAIFVADDKEPQFNTMSDALATKMPPGIAAQKIYLAARGGDVKATRAEMLAHWNAGAGLLTYIGHGSIDTWAAGPLFSAENLGEIKNGDRLPILFTPTCLDGFFYHPQKDSLAEDLLFKGDGGIIAGVVPTGLSLPDAQGELMDALFAEIFENSAPTLGEALTRAKQKIRGDSPQVREVIETFVLLGDPALGLEGLP